MNNLPIIGFALGDAQVIDLLRQNGSTVITFSVVSSIVRGAGYRPKEYTTRHNVTVAGNLRSFASTIETGDLVLLSDLTYIQSFPTGKTQVKAYDVRANTIEILKRKNAPTSDAVAEMSYQYPQGSLS